jgi:hypothetical protein
MYFLCTSFMAFLPLIYREGKGAAEWNFLFKGSKTEKTKLALLCRPREVSFESK